MTTVDPGDGYITENPQVTSGQKYLALEVPAFSQKLTSYLCLGSATQWFADTDGKADPSVHGQALANMVRGFCDDDRSPTGTPLPGLPGGPSRGSDSTQTSAETVDDVGSSTPSTTTSPTPAPPFDNLMENESVLLQVKGGWRDHSDGNRITTTFGDKVEVIRGNYKLLVLGRQDDPTAQVAGWDVSGGLVSNTRKDLDYPPADPDPDKLAELFSPTPVPPAPAPLYGASKAYPAGQQALCTQYSWEQDSDGRWGWTVATTTGGYEPAAQNQGNGRVVNYTWVDEMFTYWGSGQPTGTGSQDPDGGVEDKPHPLKTSISREWGETIVYETHAMKALAPSSTPPTLTTLSTSDGDMTTTTTAGGAMTSTTSSGGDMTTTVKIGGGLSSVTSSGGDMVSTLQTTGTGSLTSNVTSAGDLLVTSQGGTNGHVTSTTSSTRSLTSVTTCETQLTIMAAALGHQSQVDSSGSLVDNSTEIPTLPFVTAAKHCSLTNSLRSAGNLTNETECDSNLYNHQTSQTQEDLTMTGFHAMVELSMLLMELKPFQHLDVHIAHADTHLGNHLDMHIGPHFTIDLLGSHSFKDGLTYKASATFAHVSAFALFI